MVLLTCSPFQLREALARSTLYHCNYLSCHTRQHSYQKHVGGQRRARRKRFRHYWSLGCALSGRRDGILSEPPSVDTDACAIGSLSTMLRRLPLVLFIGVPNASVQRHCTDDVGWILPSVSVITRTICAEGEHFVQYGFCQFTQLIALCSWLGYYFHTLMSLRRRVAWFSNCLNQCHHRFDSLSFAYY